MWYAWWNALGIHIRFYTPFCMVGAKPLYFLAFLATGSLSKLGFSNQIHGSKVWNMEVEAILLQRWLPLLVSMAGGYWVFL